MTAFPLLALLAAWALLGAASWRVSRAACRQLGFGALSAPPLAIALAIAAFLTTNGLAGRWAGRFDVGLGAAALSGVLGYLLARRLVPSSIHPLPSPPLAVTARVALATISMGVLYAWLSAKYQMHDEHAIFGHKSMVEELRHGYYPPYPPPLPQIEAQYHYGFDVLAGALARALDLSSDLSIDLVTVFLAVFTSLAAAAIAAEHGARRSAPFAAAAIHLGAGLAVFLLAGEPGRHPRCLVQYHHPSCGVELFPTQLLNMFQHPVSLGVPLLLSLALVAPKITLTSPRGSSGAAGSAAAMCVVLLPGLSLGQGVYYGLGALALLAATPIWLAAGALGARRGGEGVALGPIARALARVLLTLAAGHGLALLLGGMFASSEMIEPGLFGRRSVLGFPENTPLLGILWHHTVNLGVGFVLLPVFVVLVLREPAGPAVQLLAFAAGGVLVPHLYGYARSWDIVKFPSAASFALVMLYVLLVDRRLALEDPEPALAWLRRLGRAMVLGTGLAAAAFITWPLEGDLRLYDDGRVSADPQVQRAIDWLHEHGYQKDALVWAQSNVAQELAVFGGISVVGEDTDLYYVGYRTRFFAEQRRWSAEVKATLSRRALEALRVGWIVLSDEELQNLGPSARAQLEAGVEGLELAATLEDPGRPERRRRIWRVTP